jgi:diguanylate cyclase (GGDEF)-like protein
VGVSVWKLTFSFIMPGGFLLLLALGFLRPRGLPGWLQPLVGVFPLITLAFGLLFGWLFDRSRIVLAMLMLALADRSLWLFGSGDAATTDVDRIVFQAVAFLLPLNLLALSLITEDSLLTPRSGIRAALVLLQPLLVAGLCRAGPSEFAAALEFAYVDPTLTAWTPIAQPALLASGTAVALQASRFVVRRNAIESGFVWAVLAVFVALQGTKYGWKPTNFFATAGLILVMTLLEASYKAAYVDEATGMPGRQAFDTALKGLGRRYSVAVIEIDQIKSYNNAHGQIVGGQILRLVAATISGLSVGGRVYHHAGDNFAALFPGKPSGDTLADLERIRKAVETLDLVLRGRDQVRKRRDRRNGANSALEELPVTISIGVAERNDAAIQPDAVIKTAYRALYQAKLEGGNLVKRGAISQQALPKPLRNARCAVGRAVEASAEGERWNG